MKVINNSLGKPNFSQRLNPDDPSTAWNETNETCNVTAAVTAMVTAGWDLAKLNKGLHARSAMDLLFFIRTNEQCVSLYEWIDPRHTNPMNEWMDVLAIGIQEYLGLPAVHLVFACPKRMIHDHVKEGGGVVVHGDFVFTRANGTKLRSGHYESLAGIHLDDAGDITHWIMDDPWGDPRTEFTSKMGDNIVLTMSQVDAMIKPCLAFNGKDVIFIPKATA
jgi:hypothetical protein